MKKPNRVRLLISCGADISIKNSEGLSALYFINKNVPECMEDFEQRLDKGIRLKGSKTGRRSINKSGHMAEIDTEVRVDFAMLSRNVTPSQKQDMSIFLELLDSPYKSLLMHPLSKAFLHLQWSQVKHVHLFTILMTHFVFSIVYSIYSMLVFGAICKPTNDATTVNFTKSTYIDTKSPDFSFFMKVKCHSSKEDNFYTEVLAAQFVWVCLVVFTFVYIGNEGLKLYKAPKQYLLKFDSYVDIFLCVSSPLISFHGNPFNNFSMNLWQWHLASLGCLLTWIQMMFLVGKLPRFGKYIQMFRYYFHFNHSFYDLQSRIAQEGLLQGQERMVDLPPSFANLNRISIYF